MKHLFIPYELALKAKEKGFNEPCLTYWSFDSPTKVIPKLGIDEIEDSITCRNHDYFKWPTRCAAPLYQQIIDWFREKHKLEVVAPRTIKNKHTDIKQGYEALINMTSHTGITFGLFPEYYEALNAAIIEAFKLI